MRRRGTFSPLFYGIRDVTVHRFPDFLVRFFPFSPLFYGIRDVTVPSDPFGGQDGITFSPLFYGIRDVTISTGCSSPVRIVLSVPYFTGFVMLLP